MPSRRDLLRVSTGLAAMAATGAHAQSPGQDQPPGRTQTRGPNEADFVFRNGPIFTSIADEPWVKAVAVRDGVITYAGDEAGLASLTGPTTRIVDLAGKVAMPGFVEGQTHPIFGAVMVHGINAMAPTRDDTLKLLEAQRDKLGKVEVVRGYGWRYSAFGPDGPNKADLDALWPATPVVLMSSDMHAAWVNSTALKMAGIVAGIPDPVPGFSYFMRDRSGEPTGYLVESAAIMKVMQAAAPITPELVSASLAEWLPTASAEGITSMFDGGMRIVSDKDGMAIYEGLEKAKKLPCRIVACHTYSSPDEDPMPAVRRMRDRARTSLVRAGVLKVVLDGTETQYTAAMLDAYTDRQRITGNLLLNAGLVRDAVQRADAEGFDVVFHAVGDRAVRLALDAVAAAIKVNGKRDRRHTISHLSLIDDEDIKRFGDLDVIAQFSAQCAARDTYWQTITVARWGQQRADKLYRMGTLVRGGVTVSFGTDWPEAGHRMSSRPLDALEVAVTRREPGIPDQASLAPDGEAITLEQAVIANTYGAARQLRLDDRVGTIATGKRADMIVLDRNIFDGPANQIHEAKVALTLMNGVVRHERTSSLSLPGPK